MACRRGRTAGLVAPQPLLPKSLTTSTRRKIVLASSQWISGILPVVSHAAVTLVCGDCRGRQEQGVTASDERLVQVVRAFCRAHRTCRFDVSFLLRPPGVPGQRPPAEQPNEGALPSVALGTGEGHGR